MYNITNYVLQYIKNNMFIPGQVENVIVIMDMQKFSAAQIPKKELGVLVKTLTANYPGMMAKFFVINTTPIVSMLFKCICMFLDKAVKDKIKLTSNSSDPELKELVHPT